MTRLKLLLPLFALTLAFILSCKPTVPSQYMQPDELEDFLVEYHLGQAMAERVDNYDSTNFYRNYYFMQTLRRHGITEAEFDSTMNYYYRYSETLADIYLRVTNRVSAMAESYGADVQQYNMYSQYGENGDTANVWAGRSSFVLSPVAPLNRYKFALKVDTAYHRGDEYLLNFLPYFHYHSGQKDAFIVVNVRYDNDSVATSHQQFGYDGLKQMTFYTDTLHEVKAIDGYFYLSNHGDVKPSTLRMLLISNIQFMRFHKKELPPPEQKAGDSQKVDFKTI